MIGLLPARIATQSVAGGRSASTPPPSRGHAKGRRAGRRNDSTVTGEREILLFFEPRHCLPNALGSVLAYLFARGAGFYKLKPVAVRAFAVFVGDNFNHVPAADGRIQ